MKKIFTLLVAAATIASAGAQVLKAVGDKTYYDGKLDIKMALDPSNPMILAENQEATVYLEQTASGYKFMLPDFTLALTPGTDPIALGDIEVPDATYSDANGDGIIEVAGTVDDLSLAGGSIHAKVELTGTENTDGTLNLDINVGWYTMYPELDMVTPIYVTFKDGVKRSTPDGGVADTVVSGVKIYGSTGAVSVSGYSGRVKIYGIDGRLVKSEIVDGNAEIAMPGGLYVVDAGDAAVKVVVR